MGGYKKPTWYSGQDLFGDDFKARTFVGAHKDRLDHTIDRVRSIHAISIVMFEISNWTVFF